MIIYAVSYSLQFGQNTSPIMEEMSILSILSSFSSPPHAGSYVDFFFPFS